MGAYVPYWEYKGLYKTFFEPKGGRRATPNYPEFGKFYRTIGGENNIFYSPTGNPRESAEKLTRVSYDRLKNNFSTVFDKLLSNREDYIPFESWYQDYLNDEYLPALMAEMKRGKKELSLTYRQKNPFSEIATWGRRGGPTIQYDRRRALIDALNAYGIKYDLIPKKNIKYGRGPGISGLV